MSSAIQPLPPEASTEGLAAIVLAAGFSSRMGEFKPLLPLDGVTAFEWSISLFREAGVAEVIAVLGHRADELRPLAERCGARCVINPYFEQGMYSSIVAGSRALHGCAKAVFMLPADTPLVRAATVRQLAAAFAARQRGIVSPVFAGRRGHPPLIARDILSEASQNGTSGPLSALLAHHESDAIDLPVADEAIHLDMDTPADYEALRSLAKRRDIPTAAECEAILAGGHVQQSVVRHSRKVADVAHRIALALLHSGVALNLELVQAGALLHDLAKGQPDHAAVGASILRSMDFAQVAEIVGAHTDLDFSTLRIDESAIVYLADKLVRGEDIATLDKRFQPALFRFRNNMPALEAAHRRMRAAQDVALAVEMQMGAPLSSVAFEEVGSLAS